MPSLRGRLLAYNNNHNNYFPHLPTTLSLGRSQQNNTVSTAATTTTSPPSGTYESEPHPFDTCVERTHPL